MGIADIFGINYENIIFFGVNSKKVVYLQYENKCHLSDFQFFADSMLCYVLKFYNGAGQ